MVEQRQLKSRQPTQGSVNEPPRLRRFSIVSVGIHGVVVVILALGFSPPQKPTFAEPLYEVALLEAAEPNYQPPKPARATPKKKQQEKPKPKPPPKPVEKTPEPKIEAQPEKVPVLEKPTTVPDPIKEPVVRKDPDPEPVSEAEIVTKEDAIEEPVSLGRIDQKDFKHNYYLQMVRARLAREWRRPAGGSGLIKAAVHFIIKRDGTVVQPFVEEPSGNSLYDRAALSAVASVKKLPPLPESYHGDQLGITVVFQAMAE